MRGTIREFVRIVSDTLPVASPIVEFGALQVPGQVGFADLRPFFTGKEYVGSDVVQGPGVDVMLDLHDIALPSGSVGAALILDTLEHVEFPHRALEEVHRVLRPDGMVVISSIMNFPWHYRPDYWRFTVDGFNSLLRPFRHAFVDYAGDRSFPHTLVGVGLMKCEVALGAFLKRFAPWKRSQENGWKVALKPFLPPALLGAYYRLHSSGAEIWRRRRN